MVETEGVERTEVRLRAVGETTEEAPMERIEVAVVVVGTGYMAAKPWGRTKAVGSEEDLSVRRRLVGSVAHTVAVPSIAANWLGEVAGHIEVLKERLTAGPGTMVRIPWAAAVSVATWGSAEEHRSTSAVGTGSVLVLVRPEAPAVLAR